MSSFLSGLRAMPDLASLAAVAFAPIDSVPSAMPALGPGDPCLPIGLGALPGDPCAPDERFATITSSPMHESSLTALNPQPLPPEEPGFNRDLLASLPSSLLDTVALNPQPLPPAEIGAGALSLVALNPQPLPPAEIGRGALSWVALNPQPLPPQESPTIDLAVPVSLPNSVLAPLLPSPAQLLHRANVIGTLPNAQQAGPELQRYELWRDVARPADQIGFGGTAYERNTLKNLIGDDPAHGVQRPERDRVLPFNTSDFIGGIGSQPIQGDRMRPPLFVQGTGDVNEVSINDIDQGNIGDCYFLGSLAAVARHDPQRIKDMVVDHGDGTYTVTFKERVPYTEPPQFTDRPITVTGDFPGGLSGNGHAAGADVTAQRTVEIWPLVFEKAFGQYINDKNPYGQLDLGGSSSFALESITGHAVQASGERDLSKMGISNPIYLGPPAKDFDELLADFQAGKAITVCTDALARDLVPSHCYAVDRVYRDAAGQQWVQLYNPWGTNHPKPMPFEALQHLRIYTA